MAEQTVYIISLKFAPGLKKEFIVLGENLRRKGFNVIYLIAVDYSNIEGNADSIKYLSVRGGIKGLILDYFNPTLLNYIFNNLREDPPSFVLFYNPHPLNPKIAKAINEEFTRTILILYLHDPYKPDKSPYGLKKGLYIRLAEYIQALTIKYMDVVISPSEYSATLFKKRFPNFKGKNYVAPLLVPDMKVNTCMERKYFSIAGGAHLATGHDTFIELINYVAEKGIDFKFTIISSSDVSPFLNKLSVKGRKILRIINNNIITDSEINEVIRESYAVFRLDREVTQSGVIPVCYMNETPIIARDIPGLIQHVKHGYNGYIIPFNCTPEDLIKAMEYIKRNFAELSKNARKSYEKTWAEWNFDKYYGWLRVPLRRQ